MSSGNKSQTGGCWGHLTRKWSVDIENPGCKVTVSDLLCCPFPSPATSGLCLFVDLCAVVFYLCFKVWCDQGMTLGQQSVGHLGMGSGELKWRVTAPLCSNPLSPLQQNKGLRLKHLGTLVYRCYILDLCHFESSRPRLTALSWSQ